MTSEQDVSGGFWRVLCFRIATRPGLRSRADGGCRECRAATSSHPHNPTLPLPGRVIDWAGSKACLMAPQAASTQAHGPSLLSPAWTEQTLRP